MATSSISLWAWLICGLHSVQGLVGYAVFAHTDLSAQTGAGAPPIGGLWEIEVKSPKGESAWRFIVRQSGADPVAKVSIFYTSPGAHPMKAAAGRARRK